MKRLTGILCMFLLLAAGCKDEYDDSALAGRVESLEQRMAAVEELCERLNTDIEALQAVVSALEGHDYVTGVVPVKQGGETVGYTITFGQADAITIYNGEDGEQGEPGEKGEDGYTPKIGVKQDTDGVYYWTVDGEWLLSEGEKVRTEGQEGVTPQLKIEDGYWHVSYNNGADWTQLGKATGADGDAMFKEVTYDENFVYFILTEGTTLTLPLTCKLDIVFAETEGIACLPGGSVKLAYTVTGGDEGTKVECVGDGGWRTKVSGGLEGTLMVTAPDPMTEGKVLVFATNGAGQVVMKALTFTEGVLSTVTDAYEVNAEGGTVEVEVTTNMEYEVYIPEDAREWVTLEPRTRAETRTDVLRFSVKQNLNGSRRDAVIELQDTEGVCLRSFTIMQRYVPTDDIIVFADDQVRKACVGRWDTDGDLELSLEEAAAVTDVTGLFTTLKTITSFDEFRYFIGVKEVPSGFCKECTTLRSIQFPESITKIHDEAFRGCTYLTSIILPQKIQDISQYLFEGCSKLESIDIPPQVTKINFSAFQNCSSLATINIPEGVTSIAISAFSGCSSLAIIDIPAGVTFIGSTAFQNCSKLTTINIPQGVTSIETSTFNGCYSLTNIILPQGVTSIGNWAFEDCSSLTNITIPQGVTNIGHSAFENCSSLREINIPQGVTSISSCTFSGCDNLTNITLPEGLISIGYEAFFGCNNLTNITIPEGVNSIGNSAFSGCNSLKNITIPQGVTTIQARTFNACRNLISLEISQGVTSIEAFAFAFCQNLPSITIPASITSTGIYIFSNCINLKSVYCQASKPPISEGNLLQETTPILYVPTGSKELYEAAEGWKDFPEIIEMDFSANN